MTRSLTRKFNPGLDPLEARTLLNAPPTGPNILAASHPATASVGARQGSSEKLSFFRITNPTPTNAILIPPLATVRVQDVAPKVGGTYNILFITMRNGTNRTYTSADTLSVTTTGDPRSFPILTGNQTWEPNQVMIFYLLSKKYYPLSPQYSAGFVFKIDGSSGTAIPGPSGIYLRIKYNPATIDGILNYAAIDGPRTRGALHLLGIGDTALWEFEPVVVHRAGGPTSPI